MSEKNKKVRTFAAIDVGSFEMGLKIFEISQKNGIKCINSVKHRLALGNDSYVRKKISYEKMEELFSTVNKFKEIMREYEVSDYKAYGTSALRETENTAIILEQIRSRTGLEVEVLSNSEQRFLDYKAIAAKGKLFDRIIEKSTAIVDIGGGSIQISLFDKDRLVQTQALKLGVLRLHERLQEIRPRSTQTEDLLDEMIGSQIKTFHKVFLKDRDVKNLIIMDEYLSPRFHHIVDGVSAEGSISTAGFMDFAEGLLLRRDEELENDMELPEEKIALFRLSTAIIKRVAGNFEVDTIWATGAELCDGIAYEYAEKKKLTRIAHDFEDDILDSAQTVGKRYQSSTKHAEAVEKAALSIFDGMKSVHGMGRRERLLLRLAAILQDCGKFINMTNVGECSFAIIANTEIIGLSHNERIIVASVVKYNHGPFEYYPEMSGRIGVDRRSYLTIAKLTAILQLANALDKGRGEKIKKIDAALEKDELRIYVDAKKDMLYEQERFDKRSGFFEEVYGVHPKLYRMKNK